MSDYEKKIAEIRQQIDEIDEKIVPLIKRRMNVSRQVAQLKLEEGMPVYDPIRESQILENVENKSGKEAASVYSSIMTASREKQYEMIKPGVKLRELIRAAPGSIDTAGYKMACQGAAGAYSYKAAGIFSKDSGIISCESFEDVFKAAEKDGVLGVLPVENSEAGSVHAVYDLLMEHNFYIIGAAAVKISHCIASFTGAGEIKRVISHPQALRPCSTYIKGHGYTQDEESNTAVAARLISEKKPVGTAVICSKEAAAEYGLNIIEEDIQNSKNNYTRFVLISKKPVVPKDAVKISLCFSLPHKTGSLYKVLERFSYNGLNLTKIESRPIHDSNFEYSFYLDFAGNVEREETLNVLCSLSEELPGFVFLGNYCETGL